MQLWAVSMQEQEYTPMLRGNDLYFSTCLYVFTYYHIGHTCLPTPFDPEPRVQFRVQAEAMN